MEPELGKSGLELMPPVPTPQFQCPGLWAETQGLLEQDFPREEMQ